MNTPFFSIVIPLYNKENYISETVQSILNQTFENYEVLVINDGSTDNSATIIKDFQDHRIRLIDQINSGVSATRNHGIREASGQYIAFLDADDTWLPNKLQEDYRVLTKYPDLQWKSSAFNLSSSNEIGTTFADTEFIDDAIAAITSGLFLWTGTMVIKRSVFDNKQFLFNEEYNRSEDREVWYKLACKYPQMGFTSTPVAIYRVDIAESLTETAFENIDYSFIDMQERLKSFITMLSPYNQKIFCDFLATYNRKYIINFWVNSRSVGNGFKAFKPFLPPHILRIMISSYFLPRIFKKAIRKVMKLFLGEEYKGKNKREIME